MLRATWDGLPVSEEKPFGVTVAVWRHVDGRVTARCLPGVVASGLECVAAAVVST